MNTSELQRIKQRYGIVGNADGLNHALDIALKIAPVDLSVLITGENGVGKEIFPRVIHDHSLRKGKNYLAVNCGAIPEGTIDSELFGHERGAFTGAVEKRDGYFTVANGGTLFLDEVGELPLSTQARLLRVLETGEFIPVGASEVKHTDVRIVAATNVNIEKAIADGKFREDLYYRLNSVSISVPPLRQRGDDVVLLFRKFALEMSEKYKMPPVRLDENARRMLAAYTWPGNVRQLKNIAENMSVTSEEREITPEILALYLPQERRHDQIVAVSHEPSAHSFENEREILYQILFDLRRDVTELKRIINENHLNMGKHDSKASAAKQPGNLSLYGPSAQHITTSRFAPDADMPIEEVEEIRDTEPGPAAGKERSGGAMTLDAMERKSILEALERNGGNRRAVAKELCISERTLYRKIKEYGL